jgi:hypothetical protein
LRHFPCWFYWLFIKYFIFINYLIIIALRAAATFSLWNQTDFDNCVKLQASVYDYRYRWLALPRYCSCGQLVCACVSACVPTRMYWSIVGDNIEIGLAAKVRTLAAVAAPSLPLMVPENLINSPTGQWLDGRGHLDRWVHGQQRKYASPRHSAMLLDVMADRAGWLTCVVIYVRRRFGRMGRLDRGRHRCLRGSWRLCA